MTTTSARDRLERMDRATAMLTQATGALVCAYDEPSLLTEICRIAVHTTGFSLAWIGFAHRDAHSTVMPVARVGRAAAYPDEIRVSWGDNEFGHGPVGTAIRTGTTQVVEDMDTSPVFAPWLPKARHYGFRSCVSLPLSSDDERLGALTLYADEPGAFDATTVRLLQDLARNLGYGIGALRTRAEHDRAIRDLAESEERYRTLIELSPDAILVHMAGRILFANQASAGVFGAPCTATLITHSLLDLVANDSRAAFIERIASPPTGRLLADYHLCRLDRTPFDAEVLSNAITFQGEPAHLLVIHDVTERQQIQAQLLHTAKLATLGEMAAGLVHELAQPLNIIRLTAEGALLFIERGKASPEWQAEQFQQIADQTERTAEIIDDIRLFSRRDDDSPPQLFDAITAVAAAAGTLAHHFSPDELELVTTLPPGPIPVLGRKVQLEQVVMNLVANARHAIRDRKSQAVPAEWRGKVEVSAIIAHGEIRITIADNGPGVPPELERRIFEPFFTTRESGQGTGLGLSVSFGIVKSMGGRLELESSRAGARFTITLPMDSASLPADADEPAVAAFSPTDAHIMVVDDEMTAGETLARNLGELGWRVSVCSSGNEAWRCFTDDPADVVITDLRMPGGDGEKLVEKLRDYDPLLPIIIVTGQMAAAERLAETWADDRCAVLKKPAALNRLGELIAGFLQPPT
jgi:two-component system, cell cycle sensor histidine kinase and response regulator CckA